MPSKPDSKPKGKNTDIETKKAPKPSKKTKSMSTRMNDIFKKRNFV